MSFMMIAGALLAFLGITGLAIPVFSIQQSRDLAKIGSWKVQTQEDTFHSIPPLVSSSALVLGIILVCGGLYREQ